MALGRWQATIVDAAGNVLPAAQVTVRREAAGAPLAVLYADRNGLVPLGNPFAAGGDGFAAFHVVGGAYRIDAVSGSSTRTWRYVPVGLAAEADAVTLDISYLFDDPITDTDPGAGTLKFNHATLASVTQVFFDNLDDVGSDVSAWLNRLDDFGGSSDRGVLLIRALDGSAEFIARVTGSIVNGTGYRKVTVTPLATVGTFAAGARVGVAFSPRGIDGSGDVSGPAGGVVDNEFVFFNGTGGKTIKGSGLLTANDANVRASSASRVLLASHIESASAFVGMVDAATIAFDWDAGIVRLVTLGGNRALGNPSNNQIGTWRTIWVVGNDATPRTLTFSGNLVGSTAPIVVTNTSRILLFIFALDPTFAWVAPPSAPF